MSRKRKTAAQRNLERESASASAWFDFEPKLRALETFEQAQLLVAKAPPVDTPGRPYYSNLGFFLGAFNPPDGASRKELLLYVEFVRKISAKIKPGHEDRIIHKLNEAMSDCWW
jgi:hypothetical protein